MAIKVDKPYAGGRYSRARFRSMIVSALRRSRWPVKYDVLKLAYVEDKINPRTGRKCKMYQCNACGNLFQQKEMAIDHKEPAVPIDGFGGEKFLGYNWTELVQRLFCEIDGLQALCRECHKTKTKEERSERDRHKRRDD